MSACKQAEGFGKLAKMHRRQALQALGALHGACRLPATSARMSGLAWGRSPGHKCGRTCRECSHFAEALQPQVELGAGRLHSDLALERVGHALAHVVARAPRGLGHVVPPYQLRVHAQRVLGNGVALPAPKERAAC